MQPYKKPSSTLFLIKFIKEIRPLLMITLGFIFLMLIFILFVGMRFTVLSLKNTIKEQNKQYNELRRKNNNLQLGIKKRQNTNSNTQKEENIWQEHSLIQQYIQKGQKSKIIQLTIPKQTPN